MILGKLNWNTLHFQNINWVVITDPEMTGQLCSLWQTVGFFQLLQRSLADFVFDASSSRTDGTDPEPSPELRQAQLPLQSSTTNV